MTKEEIEAAIAANPEVQNVLVETLMGKGLNVLTTEDQNKFVETERARIAAEKTSEIYSGLDKDFAETSGLTKEADEKTYAFGKRAITTYKTKAEQLEAENAQLKEAIKTGAVDETLKTQLAAYQEKEQEWQKQLTEKDQKIFEKEVSNDINKGLAGFKPKATLPKDLVELKIETEKVGIIKSAKVTSTGSIVYHKPDGSVYLNDKLEPADATYILNERLKDIQETGHQQAGAGTQGAPGNKNESKVLPTGLATRKEVTIALKKLGIFDGSAEFQKAVNEYPGYKDLPSGL